MLLWLILIITIAIYIVINIKNKQSYWKRRGIPYAEPKFIVGNLSLWPSKSLSDSIDDLYKMFPNERYNGMYQFMQPTLLIRDPELIKQITIKYFDHFVDHRTFVSAEVDTFWSKNLIASEGDRWRHMRATLSPSFTGSKMKIMFGLMDECAKQYIHYYQEELKNKPTVEVEMKDSLSRFTNDVIATTAFGLKCNSLTDKTNQFYLMGKEASTFTLIRFLRIFMYTLSPTISTVLKIKVFPEKLTNYFCSVIENTVETRRNQNIVRPDMIHLLMEAQKESEEELTIEDISAQAFLFFLGGFDTVSTHLSFTLYELALNPEIQTRLRSEVCSVSGPINYEALLKMKYLDMVLSESMRRWSPGIMTDRKVTKAFTIEPVLPHEKPLHLEEGSLCWIPIVGLHHDPQYFPNPDKFDPERFSEENKHTIKSGTYMPFGAGPRNCIGSRFALLETKLLIYYILTNFEVIPIDKTPIPMVLDPKNAHLTPKGGAWLGLKTINK